MSTENQYSSPYEFYGRIPLKQAIPLGIQHVLTMFVGNLTPLIILCGVCGLSDSNPDLVVALLQNAMLVAGLVTLVQLYSIGPIAAQMGGGLAGFGALLGASMVGGTTEAILGFFIRPLRSLFPSIVTGTVVLTIGISLIPIGVTSFAGGHGSPDFGSFENLFIAFSVMITIIFLTHFGKGLLSSSSVLVGIIFGYILCTLMALVSPTTGVAADGTEFIRSWVINWDAIRQAGWVSVPRIMPVPHVFNMKAIGPMLLMFIITAVETMGDTAGCIEGGMKRNATDRELSGAVICDGFGSAFAAIFGVLPNTSFSQNVGLVTMTGIVNRFAFTMGCLFLILCGLCPKLSAVLSIMPPCVLGGAAILMFSSIALSGIALITKDGITPRTITIVSAALGLGLGMSSVAGSAAGLGSFFSLLFNGSGIFPAAVTAIALNLILPKDNEINQA